jgi:hypothetical protein
MKLMPFWLLLFLGNFAHGQDNGKIDQIDSLSNAIDQLSEFPELDSTITSHPTLKLIIRKYSTKVKSGNSLLKLIDKSITQQEKNNETEETISVVTYYFKENKLIKVVESTQSSTHGFNATWYFENEKLISVSPDAPTSRKHADFLLGIAKEILAN